MAGTLVKDPTTGAFTLAPGAGNAPLGSLHSASDLGIGGAAGVPGGTGQPNGATGTDPYTIFNQNIAAMLQQIQAASAAGNRNVVGAGNDISSAEVLGAPGYDPAAGDANAYAQSASLGAFNPMTSALNARAAGATASLNTLAASLPAIQEANKPQVLGPGQSLVTQGGNVLLNGTAYAVNPDPLNPGHYIMTPTNSVGTPGGGGASGSSSGPNPSSSNSPLESVFGASNPIGAYATDPNYIQEITGLYKTVQSSGVTGNQQMLQQYIDNNAKGAPVTAGMIMSAADTYKIDPALLTTILLHESDFGTAGVGAKTMNPGNQGNTGTSTQAYPSWQQGVLATAKNIANREKAAGQTGTSGSTINVDADAQQLANGTLAPQVLQDRYTKAGVPVLYLQAVQKAKQLNPSFDETGANLKYQGQQTQTENLNSGNPITSLFSNFKNAVSAPSAFHTLSPSKGSSGITSTGLGYTVLP